MKRIFNLIIICSISTVTFSQSSVYEKYASADTLTTPYVDKIDMQINNMIQLPEEDWRLCQFDNLETFDSDFIYNVYGIIIINDIKILLIERKYREESNHWAVYINEDNKIFSHLNIAYKNSEGFLYIESEIDKDKIKIKETNDFDDKGYSETMYTVTKSGFVKK